MRCKILFLKSDHLLITTYLQLQIITTNNSSCTHKRKIPRINFAKHICCISLFFLLPLQWFLKNLKSEVLLLSKRGSHSCFYRKRKLVSLRRQLSTLQCKSCDWFLSDKTTRTNSKLQLCYQIKTNQVVCETNDSTSF